MSDTMQTISNQPTRDHIASLSEDGLVEYFEEHSRYDPRNRNTPYSIRFGGSEFSSDDTYDLSKRFYAAVRRYRGTLYGKMGAFSK